MNFERSGLNTSAIFPFTIGTTVGIMAAILGVGGGFIMVPAMIYIIGMPTIAAIGTDLFQIVLTSANVTLQQAIVNHTVDLLLALILLSRLHHRGPVRGGGGQTPQRRTDSHPAGHHRAGLDGQDIPGPGAHSQRSGESGYKLEGDTKMKRIAILSLACCLVCFWGAVALAITPEAQPKVITSASKNIVEIGLSYSGDKIFFFGVNPVPGADVVIKLTAEKEEAVKLSMKGKVGPFWMSVKQYEVTGAPFIYKIHANKPLGPDHLQGDRPRVGTGL